MSGSLGMPDPAVPINGYQPTYLYKDAQLCRVYRHTSGHDALSWNPRIPSPPEDGGRFDRCCGADSPYLYASVAPDAPGTGAYTALVETLRPLFQPIPGGPKRYVLLRQELESRSLVFFSLRREVLLASILDVGGLTQLNAPEEVCYSPERAVTQAWAHYFQAQLPPEVAGVAYNSTVDTRGKSASFVLWGDRIAEPPGLLFARKAELPLDRPPGREFVELVLNAYGVVILDKVP